jgi:hypothetical protein
MNAGDNDRHQRFQEQVRRLAKAVEAEMKALQATDRMPADKCCSTEPPKKLSESATAIKVFKSAKLPRCIDEISSLANAEDIGFFFLPFVNTLLLGHRGRSLDA